MYSFFKNAFPIFIPQGKITILPCKGNILGSKNGKTMEIIAMPFSNFVAVLYHQSWIFYYACNFSSPRLCIYEEQLPEDLDSHSDSKSHFGKIT